MKLNLSEEWCLKMADLEGDCEIGAGLMAQDPFRAHPGGWPRIWPYDGWRARLIEAWWALTGRFTLHRAWQAGYDQHIRDESARRANGGQ